MKRFLAIALLVLAATALAACGSSDEKTADIPSGGTAEPAATAAEPTPPASAAGCKQIAKAPPPKPDGGAKKPTQALDSSKKWTLEFQTSCGNFTVSLDLKTAPKATASMVSLANDGFFKDTIFHRIVPGFVIQGGDPTGGRDGGPGYQTVDKPPANAKYTHGVVAMAKKEVEPDGTAGSQFYVVTGADSGLPPQYAIIGRVTKGIDVVDRIGELGGPDEQPTQVVEVYDVKASGS